MTLLDKLGVAADVTGATLNNAALQMMAGALKQYHAHDVDHALARVMKECRRLTLADIVERIPGQRPSADEAWSIAITADDEQTTVVWTAETQAAYNGVIHLLQSGDKVGARMAFKAAYDRLCSTAGSTPPQWHISLGYDQEQRKQALEQAVTLCRLRQDVAQRYLPAPAVDAHTMFLLCEKASPKESKKTTIERLKKLITEREKS